VSVRGVQTLAALVREHLRELEAKGYAAATVASRRVHLERFVTWCGERGIERPAELTAAVLEQYRRALYHHRQENGRPLAWSTQAGKLVAVRMLLKWLVRTGHLFYNPAADLELPRLPRRLPKAVLSVSEAEAVLARPDLTTALGLRDRAILEVLYSTGIRRKELVGLDLSDLDAERGVLLVREGKGGKDRLVPVGERAVVWVEKYLEDARPTLARRRDAGALFLTTRGGRIRANRLTERLHDYVADAGVNKSGSCHVWRHTAATLMHEGGADIRDIQEMLGHAALSSTQIYTHVSIARLKEVHRRTHPAHLTRAEANGAANGTVDEGDVA
jgi:integrase/recombinase XerD